VFVGHHIFPGSSIYCPIIGCMKVGSTKLSPSSGVKTAIDVPTATCGIMLFDMGHGYPSNRTAPSSSSAGTGWRQHVAHIGLFLGLILYLKMSIDRSSMLNSYWDTGRPCIWVWERLLVSFTELEYLSHCPVLTPRLATPPSAALLLQHI